MIGTFVAVISPVDLLTHRCTGFSVHRCGIASGDLDQQDCSKDCNDVPMTIDLGGNVYELVQYHFHAPSEHTIEGAHSPLEVHFVHRSAAGELAVLGLLVEEGEHNVIMEPIIRALPGGPGETRHLEDLDLDMSELRPIPQHYYRYEGSLTTPPCSEGVHWVVMAEKREISPQQMAELVSHLHDNNRPVQPLGDRRIGVVSPE